MHNLYIIVKQDGSFLSSKANKPTKTFTHKNKAQKVLDAHIADAKYYYEFGINHLKKLANQSLVAEDEYWVESNARYKGMMNSDHYKIIELSGDELWNCADVKDET